MTKILSALLLTLIALTAPVFCQDPSVKGTAAMTSAEKPSRGPVFRPNKDQIREVQEKLKARGLYNGEATGKFNDETRAAIKVFQKQEGIRETGTLNRVTLERFGVELTDKQKAIPVTESSLTPTEAKSTKEKPERIGDNGDKPKRGPIFRPNKDQISAAQRLLRTNGMYNGPETGKMDNDTRAAVKKYQEANGLKPTGGLNKETLIKMGIELTDKQKEM